MLVWFVDNWDFLGKVWHKYKYIIIIILVGSIAYSSAYFGQGSGPIVMDNLACTGNENAITDCLYDPDVSDCSHFEDAGVVCAAGLSKCNLKNCIVKCLINIENDLDDMTANLVT